MIRITEKINIECKYLCPEYEKHVLEKIRKKFEGKSSKDYGFISTINPDIKVENVIITPNNNIKCTVTFTVGSIKPQVGDVHTGTVCLVNAHGILVDIPGNFKIFIPCRKTNGYIYANNSFHKETSHIKKETEIELILRTVDYNGNKFMCIGELLKVRAEQ